MSCLLIMICVWCKLDLRDVRLAFCQPWYWVVVGWVYVPCNFSPQLVWRVEESCDDNLLFERSGEPGCHRELWSDWLRSIRLNEAEFSSVLPEVWILSCRSNMNAPTSCIFLQLFDLRKRWRMVSLNPRFSVSVVLVRWGFNWTQTTIPGGFLKNGARLLVFSAVALKT